MKKLELPSVSFSRPVTSGPILIPHRSSAFHHVPLKSPDRPPSAPYQGEDEIVQPICHRSASNRNSDFPQSYAGTVSYDRSHWNFFDGNDNPCSPQGGHYTARCTNSTPTFEPWKSDADWCSAADSNNYNTSNDGTSRANFALPDLEISPASSFDEHLASKQGQNDLFKAKVIQSDYFTQNSARDGPEARESFFDDDNRCSSRFSPLSNCSSVEFERDCFTGAFSSTPTLRHGFRQSACFLDRASELNSRQQAYSDLSRSENTLHFAEKCFLAHTESVARDFEGSNSISNKPQWTRQERLSREANINITESLTEPFYYDRRLKDELNSLFHCRRKNTLILRTQLTVRVHAIIGE